ncbi:MAG: DUF3616 domain-containing protein [Candidatus Binatia bacterium]
MAYGVWLAIVLLAAGGVHAAEPGAAPPQVRPLGRYPLCEASGARLVQCDSISSHVCLLVADNEQGETLFSFPTDADGATGDGEPVELATAKGQLKDIEAIETLPDRTILLLGSHSRRSWDSDKRCKLDDERQSFGVFLRTGTVLTGALVSTDAERWKTLLSKNGCATELIAFGDVRQASRLRRDLCTALAQANELAETSAALCSASLNLEGAAVLPDRRIWFGVRSPVLQGKAFVLRLKSVKALQFDAIASLDLGGAGVRDMAAANGWLWVLAGPAADRAENGTLWKLPAASLTNGAELSPQQVTTAVPLPPFSEGLAIDVAGKRAFIVVDGDAKGGKQTGKCKQDAGQLVLPLDLSPPVTDTPTPAAEATPVPATAAPQP